MRHGSKQTSRFKDPTSPVLSNLHAIYVEPSGAPTTYTEPSGNTTFTVSLTDLRGPIVNVRARKAMRRHPRRIRRP